MSESSRFGTEFPGIWVEVSSGFDEDEVTDVRVHEILCKNFELTQPMIDEVGEIIFEYCRVVPTSRVSVMTTISSFLSLDMTLGEAGGFECGGSDQTGR